MSSTVGVRFQQLAPSMQPVPLHRAWQIADDAAVVAFLHDPVKFYRFEREVDRCLGTAPNQFIYVGRLDPREDLQDPVGARPVVRRVEAVLDTIGCSLEECIASLAFVEDAPVRLCASLHSIATWPNYYALLCSYTNYHDVAVHVFKHVR